MAVAPARVDSNSREWKIVAEDDQHHGHLYPRRQTARTTKKRAVDSAGSFFSAIISRHRERSFGQRVWRTVQPAAGDRQLSANEPPPASIYPTVGCEDAQEVEGDGVDRRRTGCCVRTFKVFENMRCILISLKRAREKERDCPRAVRSHRHRLPPMSVHIFRRCTLFAFIRPKIKQVGRAAHEQLPVCPFVDISHISSLHCSLAAHGQRMDRRPQASTGEMAEFAGERRRITRLDTPRMNTVGGAMATSAMRREHFFISRICIYRSWKSNLHDLKAPYMNEIICCIACNIFYPDKTVARRRQG